MIFGEFLERQTSCAAVFLIGSLPLYLEGEVGRSVLGPQVDNKFKEHLQVAPIANPVKRLIKLTHLINGLGKARTVCPEVSHGSGRDRAIQRFGRPDMNLVRTIWDRTR